MLKEGLYAAAWPYGVDVLGGVDDTMMSISFIDRHETSVLKSKVDREERERRERER